MKLAFPSKIKWGRFFSWILLWVNFHTVQAICKPREAYAETDTDSTAILFISKETTVSGAEYIHIAHADIKKDNRFPDVKKVLAVKKKLNKTKRKHSEIKQSPKNPYEFRNTTQSDISLNDYGSKIVSVLGSVLLSFKCMVTHPLKTITILMLLLRIFLIGFYKSRIFFGYHSIKNFQRPPPVKLFI